MTSHVKHHCPERLVKCQYCRCVIAYRERTNHENLCCPFSCGLRQEGESLNQHLSRCPRVPVVCPVVGCGTVVVRELLEQHMKDASGTHVTLLLEYNERLSALVARLAEENSLMKDFVESIVDSSSERCNKYEKSFLKERNELEWVDDKSRIMNI